MFGRVIEQPLFQHAPDRVKEVRGHAEETRHIGKGWEEDTVCYEDSAGLSVPLVEWLVRRGTSLELLKRFREDALHSYLSPEKHTEVEVGLYERYPFPSRREQR